MHKRNPLRLPLNFTLPLVLAGAVNGCAGSVGTDSSDGGDDTDAADSDTTGGGGENSVTATYADGHSVTFTGGTLGWAGVASDGADFNAAFMGVLVTEGAASGAAATTLQAGNHMMQISFSRNSAAPLLPGDYPLVLGAGEGGAQQFGRAAIVESEMPGESGRCETTIENSGTFAGTLTLTEVSSTHVAGSFETTAKEGSSETAHISGRFSADVDAASLEWSLQGPSIVCVE